MIRIAIILIILLILIYNFAPGHPIHQEKNKDHNKEEISLDKELFSTIDKTLHDPMIPPFNAYIPFESPPDPRYVFVPEIGVYLLPYQYLNFDNTFDRWMYYSYPGFYNQYIFDDIYGDNYAFSHYKDSPDNATYNIPPARIKIDTSKYPNKKSGFAGGWGSLKFSGNDPYNPNNMGGINDVKENFDSVSNVSDVSNVSFTSIDLIEVPEFDHFAHYHGHPNDMPFGTPGYYAEAIGSVKIPSNGAFMPDPTITSDTYMFDINGRPYEVTLAELLVSKQNKQDPIIPYTDGLYQASDQYVTDSRAAYMDSPPKQIPSYISRVFDYAPEKIKIVPKSELESRSNPYVSLDNNLIELFDSMDNNNKIQLQRGGNNILEKDKVRLFVDRQISEEEVNKYNHGEYRPIGSNRIGRGLGYFSEHESRINSYNAEWIVD